MGQPYIGEIRMFGGNFAPAGWMSCEGQLLPISENDALFNLIGTTYGGDGQTTFALPDLRGRIPVHEGPGYLLGQMAGVEMVTLTLAQVPPHNHPLVGSASNATTTSPTGNVPGTGADVTVLAYGTDNPPTTLATQSVSPQGGSQPHDNFQPYLCVNFIISLYGIYPTQN
jgi:microcystin-dependent protein